MFTFQSLRLNFVSSSSFMYHHFLCVGWVWRGHMIFNAEQTYTVFYYMEAVYDCFLCTVRCTFPDVWGKKGMCSVTPTNLMRSWVLFKFAVHFITYKMYNFDPIEGVMNSCLITRRPRIFVWMIVSLRRWILLTFRLLFVAIVYLCNFENVNSILRNNTMYA